MRRLLIIDASDRDYQELADIYRQAGYEVLPPVSGETALPEAVELHPDLILLNIQTATGLRRFRDLKEHEATRHIPVILLLERFSEKYAARGLEIGADDFLAKPFQPAEALARAGVAIRLKQDAHRLEDLHEHCQRLMEDRVRGRFVLTREGKLLEYNADLLNLLGYDHRANLQELEATRELFSSSEDFQRFRELLDREGAVHELPVHFRRRDGVEIGVKLSGQVAPDQPDRIVGYAVPEVGVMPERPEVKELAHELSARPSVKRFMADLIPRLLTFGEHLLSLVRPSDLIGERYKKVKKLGQGSFGEVWQVLDTETLEEGQFYVAKIPFSREYNKKFRQEGEICQKLSPHPGVVRLVDFVEEHGKLVILQEYVEGQTLQEILTEELPVPLVERIIVQLIDIVAHAHQHRVIHRDIKPNNIVVTPEGTVKLLDFGAAKELKDRDIGATMIGSRPFMAPEQIMGQSEMRSDIWAIGVIMYLLYTGLLPFYDDLEKVLIDKILSEEPVPPREENPDLPEALEAIILKCLKKDVNERYPDALSLKEDLRRHFPDYGQRPWPASPDFRDPS